MANEPGTLQPAPPGLLSALQLKQRGQNPDRLADSVVPTIDLTHWYLADSPSVQEATILGTSGAVYATTVNTGLTVPDDEIWWVRSFNALLFGTAGTITGFEVEFLAPSMLYRQALFTLGRGQRIGVSAPAMSISRQATAPTTGAAFQSPSMADFWAPAGAQFGVAFYGYILDATNGFRFGVQLVIDRLKI